MIKKDKIKLETYYDTIDGTLSKNDIWLSVCDGVWSLKIPRHTASGRKLREYQEIEGEEKIRQVFGIVEVGDFLADIENFGYAPFCTGVSLDEARQYWKQKRI